MSYGIRNIIIAVALLLAGLMVGSLYLNSRTASIEKAHTFVEVLVATRDVPAGTPADDLLDQGLVSEKRVLKADAVAGALSSISKEDERVVRTPMFAGDQVTARKLGSQAQLPAADQMTGTDRRLSLPVANWHAVDNKIKVGDRVDLFASISENQETIVFTAARNVEVVSVPKGASRSNGQAKPAYVFQVTDAKLPRLLWAHARTEEKGLHLALVPGRDASESELEDVKTTF